MKTRFLEHIKIKGDVALKSPTTGQVLQQSTPKLQLKARTDTHSLKPIGGVKKARIPRTLQQYKDNNQAHRIRRALEKHTQQKLKQEEAITKARQDKGVHHKLPVVTSIYTYKPNSTQAAPQLALPIISEPLRQQLISKLAEQKGSGGSKEVQETTTSQQGYLQGSSTQSPTAEEETQTLPYL